MPKYEMITLIISEGALEILQFLNTREVGFFKDLRKLKNLRTGTFFSTTTVSNRLKDLADCGAIEKAIAINNKRNVVAYKLTESGKKTLELADRFDDELRKILRNR